MLMSQKTLSTTKWHLAVNVAKTKMVVFRNGGGGDYSRMNNGNTMDSY